MKTVVLEPSTNTHSLTSSSIEVKDMGEGILKIKTDKGGSTVTHGEHGTLKVESDNVIKYVQQELNPITKKMQNAFD